MEANISQALELKLCILPGGRDREHRPIILINVPEDTHIEYKDQFVIAINYILSCFRYDPILLHSLFMN